MARQQRTLVINPDGTVGVAGLRIPAPLAQRIIAAFRGLNPDVSAAIPTDDDALVRAVLKAWIAERLHTWEGQHVDSTMIGKAQQVQADWEAAVAAAAAKVQADIGTIQG